MKIFEGKTPTERNKIIAAIVLGALALLVLGYNFIGFFPSRKTTLNVQISPTPTVSSNSRGDTVVTALPKENEAEQIYSTIPVVVQNPPSAPESGRNIFAFYEPPLPTPISPTPLPTPKPPTPAPPTPTPPQNIYSVMPSSVYAGSQAFRLEVNGNGFTPETYIYFNGSQMPTTFVNAQKLAADIPSNFISTDGQKQVAVHTVDGKLYSIPTFMVVLAPPKPEFQYIGPIIPKGYNNVWAYIQERNEPPTPRRLNDKIGRCSQEPQPGCFRLVSIAKDKVIVEDMKLGFRYPIALATTPGTSSSTQSNPSNPTNYPPFSQQPNPNYNQQPMIAPGIPNPQVMQPNMNSNVKRDINKDDVDDDGDN